MDVLSSQNELRDIYILLCVVHLMPFRKSVFSFAWEFLPVILGLEVLCFYSFFDHSKLFQWFFSGTYNQHYPIFDNSHSCAALILAACFITVATVTFHHDISVIYLLVNFLVILRKSLKFQQFLKPPRFKADLFDLKISYVYFLNET